MASNSLGSQNWFNKDGLFLKFGTDKLIPETASEFAFDGPNRVVEVRINLLTANNGSSINATPTIVSDNVLFPAPPTGQMIIEKVELLTETAVTSGGSPTLSVGLIQASDRSTIPGGYSTAFINAATLASITAVGTSITYTVGSTGAGGLIGTQPANATGPYYITATGTATAFTAGIVCVRIYYHGIGVITQ